MFKFLIKVVNKTNDSLLCGYLLGLTTAILITALKLGYSGKISKPFFIFDLIVSLVSFVVMDIYYKEIKKDFARQEVK